MRRLLVLIWSGHLFLFCALFVIVEVQAADAQHPAATGRPQLVVQLGHTSLVTSVAFSPDGRWVLTGSGDRTAKLWDAETGEEIRTFQGHSDTVESIAFSPDGHRVLTGSSDHTAKLWDVETGQEIRTFHGHPYSVTSVAFSPDGHRVLTGSDDDTAKLWDAETGQELRTFQGHSASITSVAFSPDGRRVLTGSWDQTAKLWNARTGEEIRTFQKQSGVISSVAFSPNGGRVLTGNWDGTAKLWDAETGEEIRAFQGHTRSVESVAFSPDGRRVLTGSGDGTAKLWNAETGQEIRAFADRSGEEVSSVAFSPDGRKVLTVAEYYDKDAKLWDAETGQQLRTFHGHSKGVNSVTFSLDGRRVLTGSDDNTAKLWDAETGEQIRVFHGHSSTIKSVAFSPDAHRLLTGSWDRTAKLWDADTGQELRTFRGHSGVVLSVAFSPDGNRVLTGSDDGTARLWDAETGQEIRTFQGHSGVVESVAFSPNGRRVLTGSQDGSAGLWDAETGQEIRTFQGHSGLVWSVFSPDGRRVLTGSEDSTAKLWDTETGQAILTLTGHLGWVTSVAFSPDGRRALTGSDDGTAKLWDTETGQEIRTFRGHSHDVTSVAFSPDGDRVMTGSGDGTAKLWDAENGRELCTLVSFTDDTWAVVDPEGTFDTNDLDGSGALHWVMPDEPMRALPLEIFMRDYYTPRLLARIMNGETLPPVRSIDEIENRVQPNVSIVSIRASRDHLGRADVVVRAASRIEQKKTPDGKAVLQASGLEDLRLFRNGQLVGYREGALSDGDFTFSNIQLLTSANSATFTAYAFNAERIKSATAQKEFAYDPGAAAQPHAYLLQIGVNHYQANGCELHGSATDAEELSRALSERLMKRGLEVSAVRLVSTDTETGATKQEIRDALKTIAAKATPDDVFFLSFSGHGYGDKNGQFYMLPSDIKGSCSRVDDKLLSGAITADELAEWLRPIDAGEMSFVLDSCDSASSVEANDFKPGPMGSRGLGQLAYDKRMRILAASQSNQAAHESDSLHQGLLSYALTQEGLVEGKADWKPVDQKITVGEWLTYAADEVPRIRENGEVKTGRGLIPIGEPLRSVSSDQIPAIFDFSRKDTFVLQ